MGSARDQPHTLRALVAYDGAPFHGFAINRDVRSVAGELTDALSLVLRTPVVLSCAGRTDKGVHAHGQVVSFDAPIDGVDLDAVVGSINQMCRPHIAMRDLRVADPGFDARFSATARIYRYRILNRDVPDPFRGATHWHVRPHLDLAAMRVAAVPLLGTHDFTSFCRKQFNADGQPKTLMRRVLRAEWRRVGPDGLELEIEASAFCQQMVRSIVGVLVDVGLGHRRASEVAGLLAARDRSQGARVAPPHGLMLWHVRFADEPDDPPTGT